MRNALRVGTAVGRSGRYRLRWYMVVHFQPAHEPSRRKSAGVRGNTTTYRLPKPLATQEICSIKYDGVALGLGLLLSRPVDVRVTRCGINELQFSSCAKGIQVGRGDGPDNAASF